MYNRQQRIKQLSPKRMHCYQCCSDTQTQPNNVDFAFMCRESALCEITRLQKRVDVVNTTHTRETFVQFRSFYGLGENAIDRAARPAGQRSEFAQQRPPSLGNVLRSYYELTTSAAIKPITPFVHGVDVNLESSRRVV